MAQQFAKIVINDHLEILELLQFFEDLKIDPFAFEDKLTVLNDEGELEYMFKKDVLEKSSTLHSFSFLVYLSKSSNFYVRTIKKENVTIEEYDLGSVDSQLLSVAEEIIQKRISYFMEKGNLIGAVVDRNGYTEEFEWEDFIMKPVQLNFPDEPSMVVLKEGLVEEGIIFNSLKPNKKTHNYIQYE